MQLNLIFYILLICSCFLSCDNSKKELLNAKEKVWLKQKDTIKVSTYGDYPPYQFINANGDVDGIFIDYLKLIEKKIDTKFTYVKYQNWSNVLNDAKNNKIDLISEIQETKERSNYLHFYSKLFDGQFTVTTRKNDFNDVSFSNMIDKKIVVPRNYVIATLLKNDYPDINIFYEETEHDCLIALSSGKYDAYIGVEDNTSFHIAENNLSNLNIGPKAPYKYRPTIATRNNDKVLEAIIEKAVKSISIKDRDVVFSKWVQKKYFPFYYKLDFWLFTITFFGSILLASIFFNWLLKKKVAEKTKNLNVALNKAKKRSEIKTNFIQNISHEIRTPMNGILGYSELLKKESITEPEQNLYVKTIINSGKDLVQIIDNILELSDLETNSTTVHKEFINLSDFFETIITSFKSKTQRKKIKLILDKEYINKEQTISIDKFRLSKILKNIIDNAIKYTHKGFVMISYKVEYSKLKVIVTDTGIGIKEDNKKLIFNSFGKLEKQNDNELGGIGLGLSVAKRNAVILGGTISFVSEEKKGSIFTITLPFEKSTNRPNKNFIPISNSSKKTYNILIAEDEHINFMLVNSILSRFKPYDFSITRVENGREAVDFCLENNNIDLVLMDIRMPIMDGHEATSLIKQIKPNLPVIAHTAYSSDKDIQSAIESGCDTVICKPINLKEFKKTIVTFLN